MTTPSKTPSRRNRKPEDWIGFKAGRLTATKILRREGPRNALIVETLCECGKIGEASVNFLRDGDVLSCGCLRAEINSLPTSERPKTSRTRKSQTKEAKRASQIKWVKENPAKVAALAKRHRTRNFHAVKLKKADYYQRKKGQIISKIIRRYATDDRFRI